MKQKTKLSLVAFLLAMQGCLFAQTSRVAELQLPGTVQRTIVRELVATVDIVYAETSQGNYFVYSNSSGSSTILEIDTSLHVSDFVAENDSVFFCGNAAQPFLGFFRVGDFFFGSAAYAVDNSIFPTNTGTVATLSKMVSYDYQGRHIVAIGTTSNAEPCIVHVVENPFNWQITTGELPVSYEESLLDIALTDSYVVTAGFAATQGPNPFISLRYYEKFQTPQYSHTPFLYHPQDDGYTLDTNQIVANNLAFDHFSVATYYSFDKDSVFITPPPTEHGTYVGEYYINPSISPKISNTVSIIIPSVWNNGGWQLREMTEAKTSAYNFYLLHDIEKDTLNGALSTVYELSYNVIHYLLPLLAKTTDNYLLNSIDNYNTSQYTTSGYSIHNQLLSLTLDTPGLESCLEIHDLQPESIPMVYQPKDNDFLLSNCKHVFKSMIANLITTDNTIIKCER